MVLVLKGYTTLGELERLSFDDVDVMLMGDHARSDAEPDPEV